MFKRVTIDRYLDHLATKQQRMAADRQAGKPCVGIFWGVLVNGKPTIIDDVTPLGEAEDYGDCKTHSRDHWSVWEALKKHLGLQGEYEDWPRGRVVYNARTQRFVVYLDRSLDSPNFRNTILRTFSLLAVNTDFSYDEHYSQATYEVTF